MNLAPNLWNYKSSFEAMNLVKNEAMKLFI